MSAAMGILLVAVATSLGWAVRGEWGSWWGETVPGSLAGMSIWLAFGASGNAWQMMAFGAALAIAHSVGGDISYGRIVSYVISGESILDGGNTDPLNRSPLYGLLALFLVGGMIGFFPSVALGILITDTSYSIGDLALWAAMGSLGAFLSYKLVVAGLGFRLSPPRHDYWAAVLGGSIASAAYFGLLAEDLVVLRTCAIGWLGYGCGFSIGGLIHRVATKATWHVDSWKWMEHSVGFFGGLGLGASVAVMEHGISEVALSDVSSLLSLITVFWFVPYILLSDVLQDWTFRAWEIGTPRSRSLMSQSARDDDTPPTGWRSITSRATFLLFHSLALLSLLPFLLMGRRLLAAWEGMTYHRLPLVLALALYTSIGIAKFLPIQHDREKAATQGTFILLVAVCIMLAQLL